MLKKWVMVAGALLVVALLLKPASSAYADGKGDNQDDSKSGKADALYDGDSGQGNDDDMDDAVHDLLDEDHCTKDGLKDRPKFLDALRKKIDVKGDGKLDDAQKKTLLEKARIFREEWRKRKCAKEMCKDGEHPTDAEKARIKEALEKCGHRREELRKKIAQRFGAGADGKLSDEQRAHLHEAWRKRHCCHHDEDHDGAHDDKGAHDHGDGDGKDGHGEGKGKGEGHGKKGGK